MKSGVKETPVMLSGSPFEGTGTNRGLNFLHAEYTKVERTFNSKSKSALRWLLWGNRKYLKSAASSHGFSAFCLSAPLIEAEFLPCWCSEPELGKSPTSMARC